MTIFFNYLSLDPPATFFFLHQLGETIFSYHLDQTNLFFSITIYRNIRIRVRK